MFEINTHRTKFSVCDRLFSFCLTLRLTCKRSISSELAKPVFGYNYFTLLGRSSQQSFHQNTEESQETVQYLRSPTHGRGHSEHPNMGSSTPSPKALQQVRGRAWERKIPNTVPQRVINTAAAIYDPCIFVCSLNQSKLLLVLLI